MNSTVKHNGLKNNIYSRVFFCPFSKNSRPPSKKLKPFFGTKLNAMEATLGIKKKTQNFFDKNIQNLFKSSFDFQYISRIFQPLKQFL